MRRYLPLAILGAVEVFAQPGKFKNPGGFETLRGFLLFDLEHLCQFHGEVQIAR